MIITTKKAIENLLNHGVVALPTETVYGLAARADSVKGIKKIYEVKNRPSDNPLIIHCNNFEMMNKFVLDGSSYLEELVQSFSPGPISYLCKVTPNSQLIPAIGEVDTVVLRIPDNKIFLDIIDELSLPLAAPSANISTRPSGTSANDVENALGSMIDGVVDGGECSIGIESTILDCRSEGYITILRPGSIGKNELEAALPNLLVKENGETLNVVPGSKYKHYCPKTTIVRIKNLSDIPKGSVVITATEMINNKRFNWIELGSKFNPNSIAKNLYHKLNSIDKLSIDQVYWLDFDFEVEDSITKGIKNRMNKILN
ncbi:MAG: L-threonylcarbamoyladenylate synthase [Patescibacteria group bacterium]